MQLPPIDRSQYWPSTTGSDTASASASSSSAAGSTASVSGVAGSSTPSNPPAPAVTNDPTASTVVTMTGKLMANPNTPSTPDGTSNKDWTEVKTKATSDAPPPPPTPPLYQQLINYLHTVWGASAAAVEAAQQTGQASQAETQSNTKQQRDNNDLLVYSDPKVKRSSSL